MFLECSNWLKGCVDYEQNICWYMQDKLTRPHNFFQDKLSHEIQKKRLCGEHQVELKKTHTDLDKLLVLKNEQIQL